MCGCAWRYGVEVRVCMELWGYMCGCAWSVNGGESVVLEDSQGWQRGHASSELRNEDAMT